MNEFLSGMLLKCIMAAIFAIIVFYMFGCVEDPPVQSRCEKIIKARIDCEVKEASLFKEFKAKPLPQRIKHTCEELYPGECR